MVYCNKNRAMKCLIVVLVCVCVTFHPCLKTVITHINFAFRYTGGGSLTNTNLLNNIMCLLSFFCMALSA